MDCTMVCTTWFRRQLLSVASLLVLSSVTQAQTSPLTPDIPVSFQESTATYDYVKREVMIPMRDGVKLHTVIVIPKGAKTAPIILTRTPYDASQRTERNPSPHMLGILPLSDEGFVASGYIRVFQDVRGKYGSEGTYVMARPLRGPLNSTEVDHSTDAYDTIEWLVKNVKESNGKVGMLGSSYEGFTVVMALLNPHPALKVAAPVSPLVDGWMGDDWFHFGAFRQVNFDRCPADCVCRLRKSNRSHGKTTQGDFVRAQVGGGRRLKPGRDIHEFFMAVRRAGNRKLDLTIAFVD